MVRPYRVFVLSFLAVVLLGPLPTFAEGSKPSKSVNDKILDILLEKKIIDKQKFEELKKEVQEEETQKKRAIAEFERGFFIETADKESRIRFDGRFQGDFKSYLGHHPDHASFFIRRARLCMSGTVHRYYDFRLEPEFGKGASRMNDGFINIRYFPSAQIEFGQFKTPFSMEELHSDNWIDFVERSVANKLAPSRDLGVTFHGGISEELFYYQLGLFNGYKLNQASDPDGGKDVAFRLVAAPFKKHGLESIQGLRLGVAFTYGHVTLDKAQWWNSGDFKTAAGTTYLSLEDQVSEDGARAREGMELYWDWGATALKGEYIITNLDGLKMGNVANDFDIRGGYISISHCLTGEKFVYKGGKPGRIIPLKNFRRGSSGWGALQLGARCEFLRADSGLLDQGYVDPSQYTDKISGFTVGLNWYPNEMVRFMLNYYHMRFGDGILVGSERIDDEDAILTRFEVAL